MPDPWMTAVRLWLLGLVCCCGCDRSAPNGKGLNPPQVGGGNVNQIPTTGTSARQGAKQIEAAGRELFEDMTAESGVAFTCRNGEEANQFTMLETLGGGVALFDYDNDGRLDIFLAGGGYFDGPKNQEIKGAACRLYRNLGDWRFSDVTAAAGLDRSWFYNHGLAVADYDRDGFPDLLVTGYGQLALFHNEPAAEQGGRLFKDVTEQAAIKDDSWSTSAGWGDLNGDGFPELYVCHYDDWSFENNPHCAGFATGAERDVCAPQRFNHLRHTLLLNEPDENGHRRFKDVSSEHGFKAAGSGLGVVLADLNGDSRPDIYVANDAANNFLFLNRDGALEEKGLSAGAAVDDRGHYNGSMGVDIGDYEGTGLPALWVTNYQGDMHALYGNLGRETFDHRSRAAGINAVGIHLVCWGTGFVDIDNDGWEDLVFASGHVLHRPALGSTFKQRPVLLRNTERKGRRFFTDISRQGGKFFQTPALGRGLAIGDIDNDGWPDLVVSHINSPVALLRNAGGEGPSANRWVGIRLVSPEHRDLVGSTVVLETNLRRLTRFAKGGGSYLSANDPRLLFGLEQNEQIRGVSASWSWKEKQNWGPLEAGTYWDLVEGEPAAVLTAPTQTGKD